MKTVHLEGIFILLGFFSVLAFLLGEYEMAFYSLAWLIEITYLFRAQVVIK